MRLNRSPTGYEAGQIGSSLTRWRSRAGGVRQSERKMHGRMDEEGYRSKADVRKERGRRGWKDCVVVTVPP